MQADPFAYIPVTTPWVPIPVTGSWVLNSPTYAFVWSRQNDTLRMSGTISLTGAPTATSLTVNVPNSWVIDVRKLSQNGSTSLNTILGNGWIFKSGSGRLPMDITYSSTTSMSCLSIDPSAAAGHYFSQVNATFPITFANLDVLQIYYEVPIVGWGDSA